MYDFFGAVALKSGMEIGPGGGFTSNKELMVRQSNATSGYGAFGSWLNVKDRYLGMKFVIKGKIHYGWARLNVSVQLPLTINATLTGYAYETTPNKSIIAGKTKGPDVITLPMDTGTLGHLALGRK